MKLYFCCGPLVGYIDLEQKETYKKLKIEVDIVSDTGILIMLLLVMITKMIILLLVLLLLLLTTNESNNCNNYNNNNVLIIKIKTIKMKSGCVLKWKKMKKVAIYIICLISYLVKKIAP